MTVKIKYRQQYDLDADEIERQHTDITCHDESMTQQGAPDADLNVLMDRMGLKDGSVLPATLGVTDPRYYGDFTDMPTDLREALDRVHTAEELFNALPAKLRNRFSNDPLSLYNWVNDASNLDEAIKLGLLARRETTTTTETPNGNPQPPNTGTTTP